MGELAAVLDRRWKARRLDCPRIFHDNGQAIGDFRKRWATACKAIGLTGRIVHDLRRSGVKHLIDSGVDPPHRHSLLGTPDAVDARRYHIIDVDHLRRAAERAQAYSRSGTIVTVLRDGTATPQPPRRDQTPEAASRN